MCYSIAYLEKKAKKLAERYKDFFPANWCEEDLMGGASVSSSRLAPPGNHDTELLGSASGQLGMSLFDDDLPDPREKDPDQVAEPGDLPVFYFVSGFSFPFLPVISHDGLHLYQWGLVPPWAKDAAFADDIRAKTLNARGETVFEKPSFRGSILSKRCLLPVSGFFEWREADKVKYPYYIWVRDESLFSLGCICSNWVDRNTGEVRHTFSILTTAANPLMEKIHNLKKRMPLIIARADETAWVDPDLDAKGIKKLIRPYGEAGMLAHTVSRLLNSPSNERNIPEALDEVVYEELKD